MVAVVGGFARPSAAAPEDGYQVTLSPASKVGDQYRVEVKGWQRHRRRTLLFSQVLSDKRRSMTVELVARARVMAVDSRKQAVKVAYTVERCVRTVRGREEEVVASGQVVTAGRADGKARFTIDGDEATPAVAAALGLVLSTRVPEAATDDDIFGSRQRQRVGDEWSVNAEAAARDFKTRGISMEPHAITGTVRLDGVRTHRGVRCLAIGAQVRIDPLGGAVPPDAEVDKARAEGTLRGLFPVKGARRHRLQESSSMKVELTLRKRKPKTNEELMVETVSEQKVEARYAPVKK